MNKRSKLNGYFVSGTDTGVGKTYISQHLIAELNHLHPSVKVRKPVESGCVPDEKGTLMTQDGDSLFHANKCRENMGIVTPFRYLAALAPNQAALLENKSLTLDDLESAVRNNLTVEDVVLVEGAGGIYSPIAEDGFNIDLAIRLGLDLILVVEDRLGAINQSMMAIKALDNQLNIHSIILNQLDDTIDPNMNNYQSLKTYTNIPVYHCPFKGNLTQPVFNH